MSELGPRWRIPEVAVDYGPPLKADRKYINCESVEVIELEPMLDLLERLTGPVGMDGQTLQQAFAEARTVLRAHGRLPDDA